MANSDPGYYQAPFQETYDPNQEYSPLDPRGMMKMGGMSDSQIQASVARDNAQRQANHQSFMAQLPQTRTQQMMAGKGDRYAAMARPWAYGASPGVAPAGYHPGPGVPVGPTAISRTAPGRAYAQPAAVGRGMFGYAAPGPMNHTAPPMPVPRGR